MLLALLIVAGCAVNRRYANDQIRGLPHSRVDIVYEVKGEQIATAGSESNGDPVRVRFAGEPRRLSIVYPHPNPKYGRRYAEVVVRRLPREGEETADKLAKQLVTNPFRLQESRHEGEAGTTLRSVLKREELEFLLRDVVADSFFDRGER